MSKMMDNDIEILEILSARSLCVHAIDPEERLPVFVYPGSTHYVMDGSQIVFTGSLEELKHWVLDLYR